MEAAEKKIKERRLGKNKGSKKKKTTTSKREVSGNWIAFAKQCKMDLPFKPLDGAIVIPVAVPKTKMKKKPKKNASKVVAVDCEMVSTETDEDMLARVSVVDFSLRCVYDKFVKPTEPVGDYRTRFSGIRPHNLTNATEFSIVQQEVRDLLHNKILVGHSLMNDFKVLKFGHHEKLIRDTSKFYIFKNVSDGKSPSLKTLAKTFLEETIQDGEHNSVEDARAAMKLYVKFRHDWEASILKSNSQQKQQNKD